MRDAKAQPVLLVEDNLVDARLMQRLLSKPDFGQFDLQQVGRLSAALEALGQRTFAAILLDLVLPDGEGLDVVNSIRRASPDTPIVVLTSVANEGLGTQAVQAGAQDYLLKSEVNSRLLARSLRYAIERQALLLEVKQQAAALQTSENRLRHANLELSLTLDAVIEKWAQVVDVHCGESEAASLKAAELAVAMGRALGLDETQLTHLRQGALLHDVGELAIPQSVLLKPAALTEAELELVRGHPGRAQELLSPVALLAPALEVPMAHHERWDGTGYPRGLQGEQIPLAARIFAVADAWSALRAARPHRAAWPLEKCEAYLREQAGRQFDPRVVEEFLKVVQSDGKAA